MKLNLDVEIARLLGLVCVVTAHANSLGAFHDFQTLGFVIDELCRFSVQLFFLVSGFFWKPEQIQNPGPYLRQLFPKLAIPFVIWASVYLVLDATQLLYPQPEPRSLFSYLTTPWSGGIAFHLWFLPALFIGTAIGMMLIKRLGLPRALAVVIGLFLIGAVLGSYLRLFGITVPLSVYRNGIFFAPVFLVAGYYLKTRPVLPSLRLFSAMALCGLVFNMLEGIYIVHSYPAGHDLSFATLLYGVGVFGMVLHMHSKAQWLGRWGRDVFGAYLVHVLALKVLIEVFAPGSNLPLLAVTICLAIALSLIFSHLAKKNRWTRYLAP